MKYLKEFIIGSSIIVVLPFYYGAYHNTKKNYKLFHYILAAPIWFGIWNIISLIIAEKYKLSNRLRYFIVSILSVISIGILQQTILFPYNYTKKEWYKYYIYIFIKYMIVWNFIIFYLDKYI